MSESHRITKTTMAWAIALTESDYRPFAGHGWFGWLKAPHVQGCRTALFGTRRKAREHLKSRATTFKTRVARVRVTIEEVGRG